MTNDPGRPPPEDDEPRERTIDSVMWNRVARRRERAVDQILRDRQGGHLVPTWAMTVVLGLFLAGWVYLILIR